MKFSLRILWMVIVFSFSCKNVHAQFKQQLGVGVGEIIFLKTWEGRYFDNYYQSVVGSYQDNLFGNLSRYDQLKTVNLPAIYYDWLVSNGWRLSLAYQLSFFNSYNTSSKFIGIDAPQLVTDTMKGSVNRFKGQVAKNFLESKKWQLFAGSDIAMDFCYYKRKYYLVGGGWGYVDQHVEEKKMEVDFRIGLLVGVQYQLSARYSITYQGSCGVGLPAGELGIYQQPLHRLSVNYFLQ